VILTGVGAYFLINARSLKERIGIIGDTESIFIRAIVSENAQHIAWMKMDFISYSLPTIDGVSYYYYDYDEDVYLGSDDLYPGTFIFSPDGERYAFVLGEYGEMRVVWDGEKGEIYCCLSKPVFSPDSQHIAYFGKKSYDSDRVLVLDGKEIQSRYWRKSRILFPSEQPIVFSEDSEELAFESYDLRKDRLIRVGVRDGRVKRINIKGGCRDFFYDRNELCWLVIEDNYVCLRSEDALTYKEPRYGKVGNVTYTKDKMRFAYVSEDENGKQSVLSEVR
jgi:WD40 repeat protein